MEVNFQIYHYWRIQCAMKGVRMKLGVCSNSLKDLEFDQMLDYCVEHNIEGIELACGGGAWSPNRHIDPDLLLSDAEELRQLQKKLEIRKLKISALNCSGNPLSPTEGQKYDEVITKTFRLAEKLGVTCIVTMSGLPAAAPEDTVPNWITLHFPPELKEMLDYQWSIAIPYWQKKCEEAKTYGIKKIAFENHGYQLVYTIETLMKMRAGVGENAEMLGMNLDTSHCFYMGADPIRIAEIYGHLIYYVHAKDVLINKEQCALNTLNDTKPGDQIRQRSWNFVAAGDGHSAEWWRRFARALQTSGYEGFMTMEVGDSLLGGVKGVARAAHFLRENVL